LLKAETLFILLEGRVKEDYTLFGKEIPIYLMSTYSKNQLQRYPIYLKYLKELESKGISDISSPKIAHELGYSEEQIRKDLQAVSDEAGRPKKGRSVAKLIDTLETFLGYRAKTRAVMIGVGHLGGALLNYPNFQEMGFQLVAGFDIDPAKVGTMVAGKPVYDLKELPRRLQDLEAETVVITVPSLHAQEVVDFAVKNGAKAIWNFAPTHISVPSSVVIENVNLASSLAVLSHRLASLQEKEKNLK
jgi:redox-sensing transcriptional repressor